jgi:hypothetical protein
MAYADVASRGFVAPARYALCPAMRYVLLSRPSGRRRLYVDVGGVRVCDVHPHRDARLLCALSQWKPEGLRGSLRVGRDVHVKGYRPSSVLGHPHIEFADRHAFQFSRQEADGLQGLNGTAQ